MIKKYGTTHARSSTSVRVSGLRTNSEAVSETRAINDATTVMIKLFEYSNNDAGINNPEIKYINPGPNLIPLIEIAIKPIHDITPRGQPNPHVDSCLIWYQYGIVSIYWRVYG